MIDFSKPHKRNLEPNMIPLINVVFLLLIFFLVAGTLSPQGAVPVDMPEAYSGTKQLRQDVVITYGKEGQLALNDVKVVPEVFARDLKRLLDGNPHAMIVLKADASLPAGHVTKLIKLITKAGGENLLIATSAK